MVPPLPVDIEERKKFMPRPGAQCQEFEKFESIGIITAIDQNKARGLLYQVYYDIVEEKFGTNPGSRGEIRMFTYPPIREQALIRIIESIGQFHCLGSVITYEPTFVVNRLYEILKWNRPWLMVIRERAPIQKKKPKQQEEALEYQKPDDQNGIEESTRLEAVFAYQETEEESNRWNDEWLVRFDQAGGFDFLKE